MVGTVKKNEQKHRTIEHYADWLAGAPNLVMTADGHLWVRSLTNSRVMYKGWNVKSGERVL